MVYADIAKQNADLRKKSINGGAWIAPYTAAPITTLVGSTGNLTPFPVAYEDFGLLSDDGTQFTTDQTVSESTSWQKVSPTLSETTAETVTLTFTAQETKALTLGLAFGQDLGAPDANGNVVLSRPEQPVSRYFRLIVIAVINDGEGGEGYIARFFPRAQLTAQGDQSFGKNDDGLTYSFTFTARPDPVLKYSENLLFAPGEAAADMGIGA